MKGISVAHTNVMKVENDTVTENSDLLAIEEPLEIRIGHGSELNREEFPLAVTMRTPGHDKDLVLGFLLSEAIIPSKDHIISIKNCLSAERPENVMRAELSYERIIDKEKFSRNFYTASSCGVCGKASIEAIKVPITSNGEHLAIQLRNSVIYKLSGSLVIGQNVFKHTGGLHAAGIFDSDGDLILLREDIGRHNAVDKVIGAALNNGIELENKILMLSGRIGFELVQKALVAGCKIVAAIGAPSSLAVDLASEHNMTLIGFVRNSKFNVYSGKSRIIE